MVVKSLTLFIADHMTNEPNFIPDFNAVRRASEKPEEFRMMVVSMFYDKFILDWRANKQWPP
jgi:hypothetical protein